VKAIERTGERLRVELYPNGKARTPLLVWERDATEPLAPLDAVNLDTTSDRQKFIERLPISAQAEALRLLEACAVELLRTKAEGRTTDGADTVALIDPEPHPEPVGGVDLLDSIAAMVSRYVYVPSNHAADAIALWAVATWFVADCYFAPLLAVISATKRCGKTLLLDVIKLLVRRGFLTSGIGITPAVLFRLNERDHPTFLIDEAEKLGGRDPDKDTIALVNSGHRRGSTVPRCVDKGGGQFDIEQFDAFGYRALAAVGSLWDTVMDRALVVRLARKPSTVEVARFAARDVEPQCQAVAQRIARWVKDNRSEVVEAEVSAPRPKWMNDRECDTWAILYAVASVAGGDWPARALKAAKHLQQDTDEESDLAERLIHDIRGAFESAGSPGVIKSGDLTTKLNEIETAPWGDFRRGDGLSTHQLAARLRPFSVRPQQSRNGDGDIVRGYWLADFGEVFKRYPPLSGGSGVVQAVQASEEAGSDGLATGTRTESCTSSTGTVPLDLYHSGSGEPSVKTGDVPVVPVETPQNRGSEEKRLLIAAREYLIGNPSCTRRDLVAHLGPVSPNLADAVLGELSARGVALPSELKR